MKNKIQETNLLNLYKMYAELDVHEFRVYCIKIIKSARQPSTQILARINTMNKDQMLMSVNNFAFKGHGLGVIK